MARELLELSWLWRESFENCGDTDAAAHAATGDACEFAVPCTRVRPKAEIASSWRSCFLHARAPWDCHSGKAGGHRRSESVSTQKDAHLVYWQVEFFSMFFGLSVSSCTLIYSQFNRSRFTT